MSVQKEVTLFIQESLNAERKHNKDLDTLIRDFKKYKSGGRVDYLGKDVPYHKPSPMAENAGLIHVHVLDKIKSVKFRTSDSVIIYTEGATTINTFYIIDFIDNGAHEKARNKEYMNWVIRKAEEFREVK